MSSTYSGDEARSQNIEKLGEELGEVYSELWQQVTWLNIKWEEYVVLYGSKESRIALMNESAPEFFYLHEKALWESILLNLTRLTDPPQTMKKKNLSVQQFKLLIKDDKIQAKLQSQINLAVEKTEFARDWRNRLLAHSDFHMALKKTPKPLEKASRKLIKEAIKTINDTMNIVSQNLLDSTTGYDIGGTLNGSIALLHIINAGLNAERARNQRIAAGTFTEEDIEFNEI